MNNREISARKTGFFTKILEAFVYLVIINASYLIPMQFNFQQKYMFTNIRSYQAIWPYVTIFALLIFIFNKMLSTLRLTKIENVMVVVFSTVMVALSTTTLAFLLRGFAFPRSIIIIGFISQTIIICLIKLTIKFFYERLKKVKNVGVLADIMSEELIIEKIFGSNLEKKEKLIFISDLVNFELKNLNQIDKLYIYKTYNYDEVSPFIHQCILSGVEICVMPNSYELAIKNSDLYLKSDLPLIKIEQVGVSAEYAIIKRAMDIVLSAIGLIVLSPIMLFVAIYIYCVDGKQVMFTQERVTKDNRVFTIYKFRTMIRDAEKDTGAVWSGDNDSRITKSGAFLRKYWLDELPQLFNVLKGDMSFVGPRPERPELVKEFVEDYPDFKFRTLVKCGLTGYAQVFADYDTTPKNKLKFDLFYILNSNLLFDISIIFLTVRKVFLKLFGLKKVVHSYSDILEDWNVKEIERTKDLIIFKY